MIDATDTPAIGHNQGPPLNLSGSWSGYCWSRARREAWDNPPIEVVRRRLRRADELGLTYRQYAAVLLNTGVRSEALVFDLSAIAQTRPRSRPLAPSPLVPSLDEIIERMAAKLRTLRNCKVLAAAEEAGGLVDELDRRAGKVFADCAIYPQSSPPQALTASGPRQLPGIDTVLEPVLGLLDRHLVAPAAAVMIGDGWRARRIAEAASLARVFPHGAYFG